MDIRKEIVVENIKYPIVFNLNVMEALQNRYGNLKKWIQLIDDRDWDAVDLSALKYALTLMINEGIDIDNESLPADEKRPFVTEKQVGRMLSHDLINKFNKTIVESTKIDDPPKNK